MKVIVPHSVVEDGTELVVDGLQICLGIGLLLFIPVVGFIALIYFGCAQSSFGANRWGVMPIE